jgi:hypothetical protein
MTELEKLSHDSFYNMQNYSQITIDYIEEAEDLIDLEFGSNFTKEDQQRELGSLSYRVSTIIDILNPELETDVNAFFKLDKIINEYLDKVESAQ